MSLICYPGFMSDKAGKWKIDLRGVRQWWEKSEIRTESWWERRVMVSWVILAQRSGCKMYIEEKNEIRSRNQATIKRRYWKKKRKGALMKRCLLLLYSKLSHSWDLLKIRQSWPSFQKGICPETTVLLIWGFCFTIAILNSQP